MKQHTVNAVIWLVIVCQFIAYEVFALVNTTDGHEPFTFYVRHIAGNWKSPMWYLVGGFCIWLFVHFLFVHERSL